MPVCSYEFGEFELDSARFELRRNGRALKLERIPMELLILLAEKDGNVVSRQEISERLWGKDVFVDTEHGINTAIRKVRNALHEDAERPRFVQTVAGKGYRFAAGQKNGNTATSAPPPTLKTPGTAETIAVEAVSAKQRYRWPAAIATIALLIAGALLAFNAAGVRDRILTKNQIGPIHSLAVLPLKNLSGDPNQEYFADGTTLDLIAALTKISNLRVISWTSVRGYKNTTKPLAEIAKELNADGVIDGSVERSGNRVRVTIQLIQASSDRSLWTESYDRELREILSLQDEVAGTIAREVRVALTPEDRLRLSGARPVDPEAYLHYLDGRSQLLRETPDSVLAAREDFRQALDKDPDYAPAYAGLAVTYLDRWLDPKVGLPLARAAAAQALRLDDTLSEAHAASGEVKYLADWDWKGAEKEFQRAIELNPGDATAHDSYAHLLVTLGRNQEARRETEFSVRVDPASPVVYCYLGYLYLVDGQYELATATYRKAELLDPSWGGSHWQLGDVYRYQGKSSAALLEYERYMALEHIGPEFLKGFREAFEKGGWNGYWAAILRYELRKARNGYFSPSVLAGTYVHLGDKENTFRYLEKAYENHDEMMLMLKNSPDFDLLHADPRYVALLQKMGLPNDSRAVASARD